MEICCGNNDPNGKVLLESNMRCQLFRQVTYGGQRSNTGALKGLSELDVKLESQSFTGNGKFAILTPIIQYKRTFHSFFLLLAKVSTTHISDLSSLSPDRNDHVCTCFAINSLLHLQMHFCDHEVC